MYDNLKVLVVDDQPGVRQLLGIIIKEMGHEVGEAQNGREAVQMARTWPPDVVFMDIRMPVMGGEEALEEIKLMYSDLPVVMMTAYGSEEALQELLKKGAFKCLTKPFDVEEIKWLLDELEKKLKDPFDLEQKIYWVNLKKLYGVGKKTVKSTGDSRKTFIRNKKGNKYSYKTSP